MTTTVATRRSVLSGLAVSALALAAMASFILISVSGGAEAQIRAGDLSNIADPACGADGQADCTTAEIVLFHPHSGLSTADPNENAGYQFYGTGADNLAYDVHGLTVDGGLTTVSGVGTSVARDEDLSEATGRLYTTVVNKDDRDGLNSAERVENAIVPGSDIFGIAVYDPDAAVPQTVTLNATALNALDSNFPSNGIIPARNTTGYSLNIPSDHMVNNMPVLPIRGTVRLWNGDPANPDNEIEDFVASVQAAGENNRRGFVTFTPLVATPNGLRVTWSTTSSDNFVVVAVDGNATSSRDQLYLRLRETDRGTDLYVGELQLFSTGTNLSAYRDFVTQGGDTPTASTTFTGVPRAGGGDVFVVGRPNEIVRAPFVADARDNITVRFRDKTGVTGDNDTAVTSIQSASIVVETNAPAITVTAPENESATSDREINFTGTASDSESGLDVSELRLGIANPQTAITMDNLGMDLDPAPVFDFAIPDGGNDNDIINDDGYIKLDPLPGPNVDNTVRRVLVGTENEENGLYRDGTDYANGASVVDWRYTPSRDAQLAGSITNENQLDHGIEFSLIAVDLAGNVGFSDSDETKDGLDDNFRDDFNAHVVTLDGRSPTLLPNNDNLPDIRYPEGVSDVVVYDTSQTGIIWDPGEGDLVVARNAIAVVFDGTVEPPSLSDFEIVWDDDNFATALQSVVPGPTLDLDDLGDALDDAPSNADRMSIARQLANTVFLVFDQDIPSSETPRINVSNVTDPAGNSVGNNERVDVADGLGPEVSVRLSGGSGAGSDDDRLGPGTLTRNELTIEIEVSEDGAPPEVSFYGANGRSYATDEESRPSGDDWQFQFRSSLAAGNEGVVCVVVSAEDNSQNKTTSGFRGSMDEDCNRNSRAHYFTLDTLGPMLDPSNYEHRDVFTRRPNIEIPLDAPVNPEEPIKLRIDGEEVEDPNLRTSDNQLFFYQPPEDLTFGMHTVAIQATDLAGNENTRFAEFDITISERSDFELSLDAGWNLISFPSDPEQDARVSAVFTDRNVLAVSTFDAANFRAGTQMATRNPLTGSFSGNLSEIRTGLAYWVFAGEGGAEVEVRLQGPSDGSQSVVPTAITIPTVGGVNLVGVVDPSFEETQGDAGDPIQRGGTDVTVGTYLENVSTARIQVFNTRTNTFVELDESAMVTTGVGMVVYINPDITGRTPEIIP